MVTSGVTLDSGYHTGEHCLGTRQVYKIFQNIVCAGVMIMTNNISRLLYNVVPGVAKYKPICVADYNAPAYCRPLQRTSTRLNYKAESSLKKATNWCGYQSEKIIQNVPNNRWLSRHACTSVGTTRASSSLSCNVQ